MRYPRWYHARCVLSYRGRIPQIHKDGGFRGGCRRSLVRLLALLLPFSRPIWYASSDVFPAIRPPSKIDNRARGGGENGMLPVHRLTFALSGTQAC